MPFYKTGPMKKHNPNFARINHCLAHKSQTKVLEAKTIYASENAGLKPIKRKSPVKVRVCKDRNMEIAVVFERYSNIQHIYASENAGLKPIKRKSPVKVKVRVCKDRNMEIAVVFERYSNIQHIHSRKATIIRVLMDVTSGLFT